MRITFLNPVGIVGGGERGLLASIRGAREHLPDARLDVVLFAGGPLRAEAERLGATVTVVPLPARLAGLGASVEIGQVPASCYFGFALHPSNMEAVIHMHQGRCSLPADDAGRILDRLAGLEEVIRPEDIQQSLVATGRVNSRKCLLTHEVVLWVVLAMGLFTDLPIRQVFKHARRLRKGEQSPDRSSLCVARQRLGVAPVRQLFAQIARPLAQPTTPGAFYGGFRLMGIDSTVYDVPDTPANDTAFGRPSAGPRGRWGLSPSAQAQSGRIGNPRRNRLGSQARPLR